MLKGIIVLYLIIQEIYEFVLNRIRDNYRKKPLPKEVSDIYDEKRYQDFLNYKSEYRALSNQSKIVTICFDIFILFSPFFSWMESMGCHNMYFTLFVTLLCITLENSVQSYFVDHYATFVIEEKYGMNKKTQKEFMKDFLLDIGSGFVMELVLYSVLIFVCSHIVSWTNHFAISYVQSTLFVCGLAIVFGVILICFMAFSVFILMKQYTFTDLEDEELLNKINEMRKGCKKKIKGIKVYDESKKSTTKNAFVLGIPFYRIVGIADNFLNENSKRELYGVLAHEIGHLKHKKNILNYIKYGFVVCLLICLIWLIPNGEIVQQFAYYVDAEFHVENAYYLYFMILSVLTSPIFYLISLYTNYVTRKEEYEADQNACKEGYGEDLIHLFKELSKDELVDVNPSPVIEWIEYDHPGMYRRILGLKSL